MTSQQFLVCDSSTLANFKQWAQAISGFFTTAGWSQSSDTGQVNWGTIATVPNTAYVYEIWQPNDGLTNFFLKIEYGNTTANCPALKFTISTSTNGAGTATGFILGPQFTVPPGQSFTPPSASTQFECNFSGAAGRMCVMLWRNGTNSSPQSFCVERSINSSGAYTSSHVTLVFIGTDVGPEFFGQQTLLFGVGATTPSNGTSRGAGGVGGLIVRGALINSGLTTAFNGSIPFDTIAPAVGFFDYQLTCAGAAQATDITEGVTFTVTLYGSTRTYMPSKGSIFSRVFNNGNSGVGAYCMRYD
jgi:hypothetical protein